MRGSVGSKRGAERADRIGIDKRSRCGSREGSEGVADATDKVSEASDAAGEAETCGKPKRSVPSLEDCLDDRRVLVTAINRQKSREIARISRNAVGVGQRSQNSAMVSKIITRIVRKSKATSVN